MSDFYDRRDLQAVTDFADPLALFEFGFEAPQQSVLNDTSDTTFELSWDGLNVHARLASTGPTAAIAWEDHSRSRCFVRRMLGSGGAGAKNFIVMAATR